MLITIQSMFLSERIKALAPPAAAYFRMVAHLHDERTRVYPADPKSYFSVGESPYGIPSGYYTLCFFTEQRRPIQHHNQAIHINPHSEIHRAGSSQLSLHHGGSRSNDRPSLGAGATSQPALNASVSSGAAENPRKTLSATTPIPTDADLDQPVESVEDTDLEFRKYTYAMDLEDRQQEFIKNSTYVTEVGEVFALNRIMRRELMELQRVIVANAQQAHKEAAQVKGTVCDLLQIQRDVLAHAAENVSRPPAAPPDYVGLGHSALATLREIGVALINRSESRQPDRPAQRSGGSPQLPASNGPTSELSSSPSAPSEPLAPSAPEPDLIDRMVSKLRATTDGDIALAMSSPEQWKAMLDELRSPGKQPSEKAPALPKGDETTGS